MKLEEYLKTTPNVGLLNNYLKVFKLNKPVTEQEGVVTTGIQIDGLFTPPDSRQMKDMNTFHPYIVTPRVIFKAETGDLVEVTNANYYQNCNQGEALIYTGFGFVVHYDSNGIVGVNARLRVNETARFSDYGDNELGFNLEDVTDCKTVSIKEMVTNLVDEMLEALNRKSKSNLKGKETIIQVSKHQLNAIKNNAGHYDEAINQLVARELELNRQGFTMQNDCPF